MLVKSDGKKEEAIINQLIDSDEQLKQQHEIFKAEMKFKSDDQLTSQAIIIREDIKDGSMKYN